MPRLFLLPETPGDEPLEIIDKTLAVGRSNNAGLQIEDVNVSKFHALLALEEDGYTLFDLHSVNGTYINDVRITSSKLVDGDIIRFGTVAMRYEAAEKKPSIGLAGGRPRIGLKLGGAAASQPAPAAPTPIAPTKPAVPPAPPRTPTPAAPVPAPVTAKRPTISPSRQDDRVFIKTGQSPTKPAAPAPSAPPPPIAAPAPKPAAPVPPPPAAAPAPKTEERPKLRLGGAPAPKPEPKEEEEEEEEAPSGVPKPKLGFRLKKD